MSSLKSLIVAGMVAVSLLVASVTPALAAVKGHATASARTKTTAVAHKDAHKAAAKKAAKNQVKAKKSHHGVAAKTHAKAVAN